MTRPAINFTEDANQPLGDRIRQPIIDRLPLASGRNKSIGAKLCEVLRQRRLRKIDMLREQEIARLTTTVERLAAMLEKKI